MTTQIFEDGEYLKTSDFLEMTSEISAQYNEDYAQTAGTLLVTNLFASSKMWESHWELGTEVSNNSFLGLLEVSVLWKIPGKQVDKPRDPRLFFCKVWSTSRKRLLVGQTEVPSPGGLKIWLAVKMKLTPTEVEKKI